MRFLRQIAPAGTPIKITEIILWILDIATGKDRTTELCEKIKKKYKTKHCYLMSSGRAAMAMLFKIIKDNNDNSLRNEVVIPSYTCYSVAAAAEIAGLKVRICDIDRKSLGYDSNKLNKIDFRKVLIIVSSNLYGYPNDLSSIEKIAIDNEITFIDDAAQSMNAKYNNRYAGTYGDIGLFSLDKGKNITSLQGGIIITNNDNLAKSIEHKISELPQPGLLNKTLEFTKLIIYSLLLKPWLYWIPEKATFLGLGKTLYTTDYYFSQYSPHLASISNKLFDRIDELTQQRCNNSQLIKNKIKNLPGLHFIQYENCSEPACLRLPVFLDDINKRDIIMKTLLSSGIGATSSYPNSISSLEEVKSFLVKDSENKNGNYIAKHIITLPTIP